MVQQTMEDNAPENERGGIISTMYVSEKRKVENDIYSIYVFCK